MGKKELKKFAKVKTNRKKPKRPYKRKRSVEEMQFAFIRKSLTQISHKIKELSKKQNATNDFLRVVQRELGL